MKTVSLFVFSLIFWASSGQAKVLIVSDIDDTIKISHVVDTTDAVVDAFETGNIFLGMNQLYQMFKTVWGQEADLIYLSNAPDWLMEDQHLEFLQRHTFPQGRLSLVAFTEKTEGHKLTQIRKKLRATHYDAVILIGDNGEQDATIYAQIQSEFPQLKVKTFIHQLYSVQAEDEDYQGAALQRNQVGYVTPVEIILELVSEGILLQKNVSLLIHDLSRSIQKAPLDRWGGVIMFPIWEDCRDFQRKWSAEMEEVRQLKDFVLNRCSQNPEENESWRLSRIAKRK